MVPSGSKFSFSRHFQVIGVAVFFALLLKPVALEETEEIEQVFLGKKDGDAALQSYVCSAFKTVTLAFCSMNHAHSLQLCLSI